MKRVTIAAIVVILFVAFFGSVGYAQTNYDQQLDVLEESVKAQLRALGIEEVIHYLDLVDSEYHEYIPDINARTIMGREGLSGNLVALAGLIIRNLFGEIIASSYLLRQLLVLAILAAVLHQLQRSFGETSLIDLSSAVCFFILIFVGLQSFRTALSIAGNALDDMVSFMQALLPMMAALLASVGGISSAALFHPVLIDVVSSVAGLSHYLLFPLLHISAVLGLVGHFSPVFPISSLAGLVRQAGIILLGLFFVLFSGVMVVRGAIAPVADGVFLRTAKFLTKTFIPVVGGMFSDAAEAVIGGSLLIKNTVGVFGLLVVFFLAVSPVIKLWAIILIYRIVGALIEPIADSRIIKALSSLESSLTLILVALATAALMFFLAITVLVGFANLTVVMR